MNIRVFYSCFQCGLDDAGVEVPARREAESVIDWLDRTSLLLADDHSERSPECFIKEFSQIKIPYYGERVGAPQVM